MKQGLPMYQPSTQVVDYLKSADVYDICCILPTLSYKKTKLQTYSGPVATRIQHEFGDLSIHQ